MRSVVTSLALLGAALGVRADTVTLADTRGQPRLEYQAAANPLKPYVAQLRTPGGVPVLRDSPADHVHHHALMFALSVEGVTFWEEKADAGRQVPRELKRERDRLSQVLDWTTPDGKVVLREERSLRLHETPARAATLLTWRSRLRAPAGRASVTLTGSHYYGLGARFVVGMDQGGVFANSAGAAGDVVRGTERLTYAAWCAYTAEVEGKPVTFALFDHPANLRHPSRMFTMAAKFAYLAATLNLWKEPYTLEAANPLDLRYGVAVWDGKIEPAAIEALYQRWRALPE
jgi:Methane oxygenase PmoA